MGIGWTEVLVIVAVILLLFGATRLPAAMAGLGKGIKEFKKAVRTDDEPAQAGGESGDLVARELKAGVGKHVRFLPDGTVEVGLPDGATLVEVDQAWATVKDDTGTSRIPLVQVKKIVFRA
ncbi:MAG: twin-arginine translocase TatA/TatE family subunit [Deltaproteobacteria bacterium]|nr:twin-arginine translocase TatA/TatE family subunit [Deltaproteobacteria bacterium]